MKRSRTTLTAWPAFADLMTVLAVLGLAIAAGVKQESETELAKAQKRIRELEDELTREWIGHYPCLGTQPDSDTAPVPLLRIAATDSGYRLTRRWPSEKDEQVENIPRIEEAIAYGPMPEDDLIGYGRDILAYGDRDDTYDRQCRFWVELECDTASRTTFARALGIVNRYFLISNSSRVNQCLTRAE